VRHGLPGIQIDKYCKEPVHAEDVSFVPNAEAKYDNAAYYNTRGNKRKIDSIVDVEEIQLTTAIPEDNDYYTNENGQRVQIPLMSTGEGSLIPKRPLGGKRRKTCKKMKRGKRGEITRKKTNKKMKKGKKSKITRKKRIKN
jgi:hypothetical protein